METKALFYVFLWCLSLSNPVILTSVLYQTLFQNVPSFNIPPNPKQESKSLLSAPQSSLTLPRHHLGRHSAHGHIELRTRECSDVRSDVRDWLRALGCNGQWSNGVFTVQEGKKERKQIASRSRASAAR